MSVLQLVNGGERLMLDACDGKQTIARAKDVFSWIDSDFENWDTDVEGEATPEALVSVYEMAEDANFARMFTSLSGDVSKLVLTQSQIRNFVMKHKNWLRTNGYATLFLFKENDELFVALVGLFPGAFLGVRVRRFGYASVWDAAYWLRLVVPTV
jgi:hypothetical protein